MHLKVCLSISYLHQQPSGTALKSNCSWKMLLVMLEILLSIKHDVPHWSVWWVLLSFSLNAQGCLFCTLISITLQINPIQVNVPFLTPVTTSESPWFFDVVNGHENIILVRNGLNLVFLSVFYLCTSKWSFPLTL